MTEERTTAEGGSTGDQAADTPSDTTTTQAGGEPTDTSATGSQTSSGSSGSPGASGKKSWRGRSRASKPAKADAAAQGSDAADDAEGSGDGAARRNEKKPKTEKQPKQKREKQVAEKKRRTPGGGMGVSQIRTLVARIVWVVCLVFALALAITALFVALQANSDNEAVRFIVQFADKVDLGVFDLTNPIKDFDTDKGPSTDTKTALFNYGIGAVVWLVIGRIGDRVIRP